MVLIRSIILEYISIAKGGVKIEIAPRLKAPLPPYKNPVL